MQKYSKAFLAEKAKELSVPRDTLEKVFRLHDVLRFFSETEILYDELALKGGTAINLLFFDLPRLSVDIDLDFCKLLSREEMLSARAEIKALLGKYMSAEGYALSAKSKTPHSLDSFRYFYRVHAAPNRQRAGRTDGIDRADGSSASALHEEACGPHGVRRFVYGGGTSG